MKKHKKLKTLIFSVLSTALSLCLLLVPTKALNNQTYAASPVSHYGYSLSNQSASVSIATAVSDANGSSTTVYLYPHKSNSNTSVASYFGYYSEKDQSENNVSTTTELIHSYYAGKFGVVGPHSAQFTTTISVSNNLQLAIKQGYVSISASAYTKSSTLGSTWGVEDKVDTIVMELNAYNDSSSTGKSVSGSYEGRTEYPATADTLSLSASDLVSSGLSIDRLELSFKSETNGQTGEYMAVKEPTIIFTTTDTSAPVLSNPTFVNQKTSLPTEFSFSVTDSESGIQKVEIKNGTGAWETIGTYSSYTTSANFTYSKLSGSSVLVKVTDNVGNESIVPYVFVGIQEQYLNQSEDIVSSDLTNINLNNYQVYVNKILDGEIVGKQNLSSNITTLNFDACGNYTFEVVVADANGNILNSYQLNSLVDYNVYVITTTARNATITASYQTKRATANSISFAKATENSTFYKFIENGVEVDISNCTLEGDNYTYTFDVAENHTFEVLYRQKISIEIGQAYIYNPSGFVPTIVVTEVDSGSVVTDYLASHTYYNADKTTVLESIIDAGSYAIETEIDTDYYFGSATQNLTISQKEIEITMLSNSVYEFDGEYHLFDFDAEVMSDKIIVSYMLGNTPVSNPINAGTYFVLLSLLEPSQNYKLSYTTTYEIQKRKIEVVASSYSLTYGDADPVLEYEIKNNFESSGLNFTIVSKDYTKNVGSYDVTFVQSETLTESEKAILSNYEVTYTNGKINISQKQITVQATNLTKVYGEDKNNNIVDYLPDIDGLLEGETLSGSLVREAGEDVGYYAVSIGTLENPNYAITLAPATYSITKRVIFIRIKNASITYGDVLPNFEIVELFEKTNILPEDIELIKSTIKTETITGAGDYVITANTESLTNFAPVVIEATLNVSKKQISIVLDNKTKEYGQADPELTYSVSGLVGTEQVSVNLTREQGETVGSYAIQVSGIDSLNYTISNLDATAVFEITKANLVLPELQNKVSVYTSEPIQIDEIAGYNLTYKYFANGEEVSAPTSVGIYEVVGYFAETENYNQAETNKATLEITKANLVLPELQNKVSVYTSEPVQIDEIVGYNLIYKYFANGDEVSVPTSVGIYEVVGYFAETENYNQAETNKATLEITKANLVLPELQNQNTVYNTEPQYIQTPTFEFDLKIEYKLLGKVIIDPTVAGKYSVQAIFEGNENYNPAKSNVAEFEIKQKLIPISMKKTVFVYNGKQQAPEFEVNLSEEVELTINYSDGVYPIEIGEYEFEIRSNDVNYTCKFVGIIKIVPEFYSQNSTGSASVGTTNVSFAGSGIEIYEEINSNLSSKFKVLRDERKCISVYAFKNIEKSVGSNEVFTVKIKANEKSKDVQIWSISTDGKMSQVAYAEIDGYYVFSVNNLSSKLIVTQSDNTLFFVKVILLALTLVLSVTITKSVKRYRFNKYFKKNTVMSFTNQEEILANAQIVSEKIYSSGLSAKDFLKSKE